ncbi:MAG TPA: 4Fe-4S dicluster domain-containing protein [Xanthomonadales bacterium]|nr:4Fe-4S dicluster domain-containing protein [Xanthomonadales bacterium]
MAKSPYRPYTPNPEQLALVPAVSGNTINGLGETEFRRARRVYWHDPDTLAHGEMQKWFYTQDPDNAAIAAARAERAKILALEVPEVSGQALLQSAEDWSRQLAEYAGTLDMELFGIARLNPDWTFEGVVLDYQWVIMLGVAHDYEGIRQAPLPAAGAEVVRQYGRAAKATKDISTWIRQRGWDASPQAGPMAGPLLMIPHALECGFGELGKHASIINKDYGSSFRLAAVLTNVPLIPTPKASYGVDDFCSRCQVCSNACPPDAILPEKMPVRGETKWYVDFDKCIPFFNEHFGCGICIAVCPWSIPGRGPRIVEQLLRRMAAQPRSAMTLP